MTTKRIITEQDIIAARQRLATEPPPHDFEDALLASSGLTPAMIREWMDATVNVNWCACEGERTPAIACPSCGLPPYWRRAGNA